MVGGLYPYITQGYGGWHNGMMVSIILLVEKAHEYLTNVLIQFYINCQTGYSKWSLSEGKIGGCCYTTHKVNLRERIIFLQATNVI